MKSVLPLLALTLVALPVAISIASATAPRPNLILILADEMGYADPAFFGGTAVPTPHLDAQPLELFDLEADLGETRNLLDRQPDIAARLAAGFRLFLDSPRDRSGFSASR